MAALTDAQKIEVIQTIFGRGVYPRDILKTELQTEITNIDTWVEDNKTALNNALTTTYKTKATANQKEFLLAVIMKVKALE